MDYLSMLRVLIAADVKGEHLLSAMEAFDKASGSEQPKRRKRRKSSKAATKPARRRRAHLKEVEVAS